MNMVPKTAVDIVRTAVETKRLQEVRVRAQEGFNTAILNVCKILWTQALCTVPTLHSIKLKYV